MRVLLVSPRFAPDLGGVETHVLHLATELADAGHHVSVATVADRGLPTHQRLHTHATGSPIEIQRALRLPGLPAEVPPPGFSTLVTRLAAHADVVHVHSYHALPAMLAARTTDKPVIATLHYHGTGHTAMRTHLHRIYRPAGRALVRHCSRVIAVSGAEKALLRRDFAADLRHDPIVIPNGTTPPLRGRPFNYGEPIVLSVCRLEPYKRVDTLIAARTLARTPWRLVVVGDGPDRDRLCELAGPNVEFTGRVSNDDLARWWATANLVASASTEEAFGITVAEALSAGIPVVMSAIGAHRELASIAGTGTLLDSHDPQVWADVIDAAITSPAPAPTSLPSWGEVAQRTAAVYREALTWP